MLCLLLSATFVDSGSVLTNGVVNNNICWFCTVEQNVDSRMDPNQQIGVVNNNICWFCTVEQNVDSRMDPNQQIVSPKTRETTNYTVGYLLTHQQVCWSTRWVQQPDCSFCAHFNKWCCPESTKFGAPTVSSHIILHHLASLCIILHHHVSSCIIMHHLASSCIILHHLASSYIILHHLA